MSWEFLDLEELNDELEEFNDRLDDDEDISLWEPDERERYEALKELDEEIDLSSVIVNDSTAIHEDFFEDYCEEFAYDCGMVDKDSEMRWYIDWEKFANDMRHDYYSFDFEGSTYLVRSW